MEEVVAYKCEHCNKISRRKGYIKQHEKKCYYNPLTKSGATCKYLIFGSTEDYKGPHYLRKNFQGCTLGLDVALGHLKTNCENHEVLQESDDGMDLKFTFRGPYVIRDGELIDIPWW